MRRWQHAWISQVYWGLWPGDWEGTKSSMVLDFRRLLVWHNPSLNLFPKFSHTIVSTQYLCWNGGEGCQSVLWQADSCFLVYCPVSKVNQFHISLWYDVLLLVLFELLFYCQLKYLQFLQTRFLYFLFSGNWSHIHWDVFQYQQLNLWAHSQRLYNYGIESLFTVGLVHFFAWLGL